MTDLPEGELMSDELTVVEFDGDEAVAEAIAGMQDSKRTRGGLLAAPGALAGVGAFAALMPRSASARSGGSKANDVKILNYALTLEYLEAAFYAEALRVGGYTGAVGRFASVVASHEATHVATLKGVLGSKAVKSPSFDFKGTTRKWSTFLRTAKVLEDTGVAAYQGQAPLIHQNAVLGAGRARSSPSRRATPRGCATCSTRASRSSRRRRRSARRCRCPQVLSAVKKTGFIKS